MAKKNQDFEAGLREVAALVDHRWAKQHPMSEQEQELIRQVAEKSWDMQEKVKSLEKSLKVKLSTGALRKLIKQSKAMSPSAGEQRTHPRRDSGTVHREEPSSVPAQQPAKRRTVAQGRRRSAHKSGKAAKTPKQ